MRKSWSRSVWHLPTLRQEVERESVLFSALSWGARTSVWLGLIVFCCGIMRAAEHYNVLLICVDDLKPTLGCYGDAHSVSPNIDALATSGIRFGSAYCNQAVCSPSRNALMVGLRPQSLGIYDLATNFRQGSPDAVTMAQHFRRQGYQTASLGKIFHTGHGNFDDIDSWSVTSWRPKVPNYALPQSTSQTRLRPDGQNRGNATESADVPDQAYADGQIADEAIVRLRSAQSTETPFFLAVGFLKPHLPFVAPKRYWDLYDPEKLPLPSVTEPPAGAPAYAPTVGGELRSYADIPAEGPVDLPLTRHLIHGYYAATSYTDAQIGRVLKALDDCQLRQKTIVVLWGDHGWHLGDHGMWCKHSNYEQATRIPLIVRAPGRTSGVAEALVETVDIYPTLVELAGLPAPTGVDGRSFAQVVQAPSTSHRDHVIHVYPRNQLLGRAIRTERYRMVEWKKPGASLATAEYELYDYQVDPQETKNLASELPEVLNRLKSILASHPEARPAIASSAGKNAAKTSKKKAKKSN